jgi:hypothetical protein
MRAMSRDQANQICPVFAWLRRRVNIGYDHPDAIRGNKEEVLSAFRRLRDEIGERLRERTRPAARESRWSRVLPAEPRGTSS